MKVLLRATSLAVSLIVGACSVSTEMAGGSGDGGATGGSGGVSLALRFEETSPLMLAPSETREVTLSVSPASPRQVVRFALVDAGGDVADAALSHTEQTTDESGLARVSITAPRVPTTFGLRALVGSFQALLEVAVEASGQETLFVEPSYAGNRTVTEWIAAVYDDGRTCADLEGNPPLGPNPARSVTVPVDQQPIEIRGVPVGKPLAVTVRAGQFAGGCSGIGAVVEGQPNSVLVTVTNRPIQLEQSSVALRLALSEAPRLVEVMQPVVDAASEAVLAGANDDVDALLDAMGEAATSATCSNFERARTAGGWDTNLGAALGSPSTASIRDDLARWLAAGIPGLEREDALTGELSAEGGSVAQATLTLSAVAGFSPSAAGFPSSAEATWTADAGDNVVLGATLAFNPSALLVELALEPAAMEQDDAASLAEALSLSGARCEEVASALIENGQAPAQSCLNCDLGCTRLLCEHGLERLVERARAASAESLATLRLAATAHAEVGEQAELQSLSGSWVGALELYDDSTELGGELEASGDY